MIKWANTAQPHRRTISLIPFLRTRISGVMKVVISNDYESMKYLFSLKDQRVKH